jgi:hypothetical protein
MTLVHHKLSPYTHYIGRPGPFGNPFPVTERNGRETAIADFKTWALTNKKLMALIKALPEDAVLGCWCLPPLPCHGSVIIELWKGMHQR